VDYLIRTHGQDAIVALIRSYAEGRTDDEAFSDALGVDMSAFGEAWLADLGAAAPTRYGPQPAPPGPIPDAWLAEPGASAPAPSGDAAATAGPSSSSSPGTQGDDDATTLLVILIAVAAVVLIVLGIALSRRRTSAGSGP
jgi:hypothetical protein